MKWPPDVGLRGPLKFEAELFLSSLPAGIQRGLQDKAALLISLHIILLAGSLVLRSCWTLRGLHMSI